jgi:N-acetylmuramoyl-L-alanine amidase
MDWLILAGFRRRLAAASVPRACVAMLLFQILIPQAWAQDAPAATKVAATGVSVRAEGRGTQVVVDLTAPVDATFGALLNPRRMTIDLPDVYVAAGAGGSPKGQGIVAGYRFGMFLAGRSRIVLDLAGPAKLESAQIVPGPAGARLIITVGPATAEEFETAARAAEARAPAVPLQAGPDPKIRKGSEGTLPLVVIDPGHGGIDAGAAAGKEQEKAIVLQFGQLLREKLVRSGVVRVEMTREGDTFVTLNDRVRFGRDRQAALMVSIHADTLSDETGVRGATIYTAAERASDERSARLAEKENRADLIAGVDSREDVTDVADILFDLTRRETRHLSMAFAQRLVTTLDRTVKINKNPLRSAGFRVLKAPDVPSILLELGYLSSPDDVRLLTSADWREAATTAVADAIIRHFAANAGGEGTGTLPPRP